ncbi:c-type cytochrome [Polluticoccus soli]|uniref:c-type cytochrome n=1 Tax=Polluticoccus soli TaxID=3034150 RepID=UPI0023E1AC8B|nr:cytochrome c [Flavipsychrobacter sp. JY13-12]
MKQAIGIILSALVLASCGNSENTTGAITETPAETMVSAGEQIFINNCAQCHTVKADKIGPKLEGALARWDNDTTRFRAFVRSSQEMINAGDPRAVQVAKEWNYAMMTPMPHLTDKDIDQVLEYINSGAQ